MAQQVGRAPGYLHNMPDGHSLRLQLLKYGPPGADLPGERESAEGNT